jgi:hypothetical protein
MKTKAREYLAKAKQCEERVRKIRDLDRREWQVTIARVYRMLAEAEREVTARRLPVAAQTSATAVRPCVNHTFGIKA